MNRENEVEKYKRMIQEVKPKQQPENSQERSSHSKAAAREKSEFFNNLVYSSFQYPKGSASFRRQERFGDDMDNVSPGPGEYMVTRSKDVSGSGL